MYFSWEKKKKGGGWVYNIPETESTAYALVYVGREFNIQ